ncbi:MAG: TlyA family RNA methyltransferase [Proteobacteria bacterium]|nr:TlyA family RNA methyltransferase [Pseudomonadota bacterium]MBU4471562.1 TlyA family RNA methyltransferase [Pseudomonadota bacterium]MCG2752568.1 TlyA family RNA methyltransferase [Desulfobacteraceae bacterium]
MSTQKKRLDLLLVEKNLASSRQRSQALILAGRILVDHEPVDKPGTLIPVHAEIILKGDDLPFVSRGGLKLDSALNEFNIDVKDLICLDVGASTGGFTDCLLQRGASKVFAVDVGYGQLAWKIRNDTRVLVLERTNIRHLPEHALPCLVDFACIDVSFISLKIVIPATLKFMKKPSRIVALIKPQFEVGKGKIGKGGIVRDPELQQKVLEELPLFFSSQGLFCESIIPSPVLGAKGNKEFLISLALAE